MSNGMQAVFANQDEVTSTKEAPHLEVVQSDKLDPPHDKM